MAERKSKRYDNNFKQTLVELYKAGNKTYKELSDEYGVPAATIRDWVEAKTEIKVNDEIMTKEEILKLKKEIANLKEENEILKKVTAIFAKR